MLGTDSNLTKTEAVAIFHDVQSFQAAIDDLLLAGFDHVDINVLAHEDTVTSKLGRGYKSTAEFEDNPEAPRIGFVPGETIGEMGYFSDGTRSASKDVRLIVVTCAAAIPGASASLGEVSPFHRCLSWGRRVTPRVDRR